ncbi:antirestriction protein ArdA [Vibrio sp. SCSIO 43140]|uniref:antirestriction protein ArdA n=1 Tax=Vibrio sp. SCSIO 43140 TaxID=2819100 RepID=UPI00256F3B32|nr:antirestriction protein ArdA [Vibrio sp. SCSIO 43140]
MESASDAYRGQYENEEAFAMQYVEDSGLLDDVPSEVVRYFDYEQYASDLFCGDFTEHDGHVFSNC